MQFCILKKLRKKITKDQILYCIVLRVVRYLLVFKDFNYVVLYNIFKLLTVIYLYIFLFYTGLTLEYKEGCNLSCNK